MNRYAVIQVELFNDEMLIGHYPVIIERNGHVVVEYLEGTPDPAGDGWIVFEGVGANVRCSQYLGGFDNDGSVIVNGAYYRRTGELDENGNYYLEHSEEVVLSDGTVINASNKELYDGSEGWHWYDDGDVVGIATPSVWERIKNWFS